MARTGADELIVMTEAWGARGPSALHELLSQLPVVPRLLTLRSEHKDEAPYFSRGFALSRHRAVL